MSKAAKTILLLLLVTSFLAFSQTSFTSERFIIQTDSRARVGDLSFYARLCEEALTQLAPNYSWDKTKEKPIKVYVSPTPEDFLERTGMKGSSVAAVAFPQRGDMVLNGETIGRMGMSERYQTIGHELVHLLLGRIAENEARVPDYLHEGLAQLLTSGVSVEGSFQLAWANLTNTRIPMVDLIGNFPYDTPRAELAYAQSAAFSDYMIRKELSFTDAREFLEVLLGNRERAKTLLARLADRRTVELAEAMWHGESRGARNWLLVITSNLVLWPLLALMVIVVYIGKKRHAANVMKEWDPWEREDENP